MNIVTVNKQIFLASKGAKIFPFIQSAVTSVETQLTCVNSVSSCIKETLWNHTIS